MNNLIKQARIYTVLVLTAVFFSFQTYAADPESTFVTLGTDKLISGSSHQIIATTTIYISAQKKIYLQADGRYYPSSPRGLGTLSIKVDGSEVGNQSIIDWGGSTNPVQHSFNCIALVDVTPGYHTFQLIAYASGSAKYYVGSRSGLSVLANPAPYAIRSSLPSDSPVINVTTYPNGSFTPIPMNTILTNSLLNVPSETPVITMASGRTYRHASNEGDALWAIFLNNESCINNDQSTWSVNDLINGSELHAPLFSHAYHTLTGDHSIHLKAGELSFNYIENQVQHKIGHRAELISMYGMGLSGRSILSTASCDREDYFCFGASNPISGCSSTYTDVEFASVTVDIPVGHNGIVQFIAKTRVQGDKNPSENGNVLMWLNIDGTIVGTLGVQQIKNPNGDSQRTISASYLSSGVNALTPGTHVVKVFLRAEGTFAHVSAVKGIPLIYFD